MNTAAGKYIISGGPGSGKTTLLNHLQVLGYDCSAEVSRRIIIQEVSLQSDCLPWKDISCFSDKVLEGMISSWNDPSFSSSLSFFDRGIPDIIAYLRIADLPVPKRFTLALEKAPYQSKVFILPPWDLIYINDNERWQSFEEATLIYDYIKATYLQFGFELIELPKVGVEDRAAFIINFLNKI